MTYVIREHVGPGLHGIRPHLIGMLLSIGRSRRATDLPDLLLDCHDRIRHFAALAVRLATHDASYEERAGVAAAVARYFERALPLHVRDEEESILPRLRGREPEVDAALACMQGEHATHEEHRIELVTRTLEIATDGHAYDVHRERLRELAPVFQYALLTHLEPEERVIVPSLTRLLTVDERRAIIAEMRARREDPSGS